MSKLLSVYFCLLACLIQQGLGKTTAYNSRYRTWITDAVVAPYRTAYTALNEQIIQKLLTIDVDSDEATIQSLIQTLVCAAQTVQDELNTASEASEQIRSSLDFEIASLLRSINQKDKQLQWNQQHVSDANMDIESTRQKIAADESALRDYQQSLDRAQHNMDQAQKELDNSNNCGRRRKKRFLGFRHFSFCNFLGKSGSENAHQRMSLAQETLYEAQHRFNYQKQKLANQRSREKGANARLVQVTDQITIIQNKLSETRAAQARMVSFTKQFKDIEVHLGTVLGSSAILQDAVKDLIDFELVISPLNAIYNDMISDDFLKDFDTKISVKSINQGSTILEKISEKMPKMPMYEFTTSGSGATCF